MKVLTFKNDTVSVGDVFVSSWGYEQTNVTFYRVLSVHGKKNRHRSRDSRQFRIYRFNGRL